MRKSFVVSLSLTALLIAGAGSALAQDKKDGQQAGLTCDEAINKPLSDEQLKKLPDDQRKEYLDFVKQCKDASASIAKAKNTNEIVNRTLKEGNDAFTSKNYDLAIAKYDEGYNADPEFVGSVPVLLGNKAIALRERGKVKYNTAVKEKDAAARKTGKEAAGKDFAASVEALQKSLDVLNKAAAPADAAKAKEYQANKNAAIASRVDSYRLLFLVDSSKAAESAAAFEEYIATETDAAKKQKAQLELAQAYFAAGDIDKAVPAYQVVLAANPNNPDALYDMGSLVVSQNLDNDAKKTQESLGYFERFLKAAPSNYDQAKVTDAKGQIEVLTAASKGSSKPAAGKRRN